MAHLEEVTEAQACEALSRFRLIDPQGKATVQSAVAGARCLAVVTPHGTVTCAVRLNGRRAWISAAAGKTTAPAASLILAMLEAWAMAHGAAQIGFQTARPGLARIASRCGYLVGMLSPPSTSTVSGFTARKRLNSSNGGPDAEAA